MAVKARWNDGGSEVDKIVSKRGNECLFVDRKTDQSVDISGASFSH